MATRVPTVGEYMTSAPYSIGSDQPLAAATHRMNELGIRHLPVLRGGMLIGIVTERDIALVESLPGVDSATLEVEEAMTEEPFSVQADASLHEVATSMAGHKWGAALVLRGQDLVGVFTTTDALQALSDLLGDGA